MTVILKEEPLFCSRPFRWFEVTQVGGRGNVYMCCSAWVSKSIGNLMDHSVADIWNGEEAQEIRRSILDGTFRYCSYSRCSFLQTVSGPVSRLKDVKDEDLKKVIQEKLTTLPYGPRDVICCYDLSCNLSCPSCRTNIIVERRSKKQILEIQNKLKTEALSDAEFLLITGSGDPFGSPFFREWLQTMRKEDFPQLKWIHLQTNGQLWTPKMWSTIDSDIQQIIKSAEVSIDAATSETYSKNRRGGKFNQLLQNLAFIGELRRGGPLKTVMISMVVQENNFMEMPDFIRLGKRFDFDTVYFSKLLNYGAYSEEEYKNRALHFPSHPKHSALIDLLKNDIFLDPIVNLGNLTELI